MSADKRESFAGDLNPGTNCFNCDYEIARLVMCSNKLPNYRNQQAAAVLAGASIRASECSEVCGSYPMVRDHVEVAVDIQRDSLLFRLEEEATSLREEHSRRD